MCAPFRDIFFSSLFCALQFYDSANLAWVCEIISRGELTQSSELKKTPACANGSNLYLVVQFKVSCASVRAPV